MTAFCLRRAFLILLALAVPRVGRAADPAPPGDLIVTQDGDLPLILTAPHGGTLPIPGATLRVGKGVSKFVAVTDVRTDELARQIAGRHQGPPRPFALPGGRKVFPQVR